MYRCIRIQLDPVLYLTGHVNGTCISPKYVYHLRVYDNHPSLVFLHALMTALVHAYTRANLQ